MSTDRASTRRSLTSAILGLAFLVAACTSDTEPDTTDQPPGVGATTTTEPDDTTETSSPQADDGPTMGGRLVIGVETEDPSYDTFVASKTTAGRLIAAAIFDTPVAYDANGLPTNFVAERVESNADGTVWTIELRPGIVFHDGTPLDAAALKFHIDTLAETAREMGGAYQVLEEVTLTGELTVEFGVGTPWVPFRDALASERFYMTSPNAVQEFGVGEALGDNPVGTGPFVFKEWVRGSHLTVERNPNYWLEGPYLDEVEFRFILDEDARMAALRSGDIDVALFTGGGSSQFADDERFGVIHYADGVNGVVLNSSVPPFDDARVRRALAHALDRDTLRQVVWNGVGDLNSSPLTLGNPFHVDSSFPQYDPAEAQRLIEEYEAETGSEVSFAISWPSTTTGLKWVQILQTQWQQVGIEVEVPAPLQSAAFIQHLIAKDHQVGLFTHPSHFDPDLWLSNIWTSDSFLNFALYGDEQIDALLVTGKTNSDPEVREQTYTEFQQIVGEALPWLFINDNIVGTVFADHVRGMGEWQLPEGAAGHGQESRVPFMLDTVWIDQSGTG